LAVNETENHIDAIIAHNDSVHHITILKFNVVGQMIGVDRGARLLDVSHHRSIIAMDQIREIRPNLSTRAANGVALVTGSLIAKEDFLSFIPVSARDLRNLP